MPLMSGVSSLKAGRGEDAGKDAFSLSLKTKDHHRARREHVSAESSTMPILADNKALFRCCKDSPSLAHFRIHFGRVLISHQRKLHSTMVYAAHTRRSSSSPAALSSRVVVSRTIFSLSRIRFACSKRR